MSGLFSWLASLFSSAGPGQRTPDTAAPQPVAADARLFTPAAADDEPDSCGSEHARQLEEHLFCWLLDTEPRQLAADVSDDSAVPERLRERLYNGHLQELPRRPMSLPMLMQALSDEYSDRQAITEIILQDPALTDQLLQVANSPWFRPSDSSIESVDQAVFLLGVDGIRDVISASIMRPLMTSRNSRESVFAQRCWLWGLACARAAETIARLRGEDASAHFMVGLLPSLAYLTLYRELARIFRRVHGPDQTPEPALIRQVISSHRWDVCQIMAREWQLPPKHHALLLAAEQPVTGREHPALTDGMLMGTREVLRSARQRNLGENELRELVSLDNESFVQVRRLLRQIVQET